MSFKAVDQIHFHFLISPVTLRERARLKRYIAGILKKEGKALETVNYIFCDDAYLLKLNQQYLNHDTLTDIITFEYSAKGAPVLSDIYISVDRVRENARQFNTTLRSELHRVIFHGILHLCGYKDKTEKDSAVMRRMEQHCLESYFGTKKVSRDTVSHRNVR